MKADDSLTCLECGATAKWIKRMGEHWCYHCKDIARLKGDIELDEWDVNESTAMQQVSADKHYVK